MVTCLGQSNPCTIKRIMPTTMLGSGSGGVAGVVGAAGGRRDLLPSGGDLGFLGFILVIGNDNFRRLRQRYWGLCKSNGGREGRLKILGTRQVNVAFNWD